MLKDKTLTYISLFSSAGVGCYGFKEAGFSCIATNELIERRLNVQKYNNKCRFDSGYICGDATNSDTKQKIYHEIHRWKKLGNDRVDVIVATPPCQGISVTNHKKNDGDLKRNSLVIESVEIVKEVKPRFFVFENVMAFEKTYCITKNDRYVKIGDFIREELGDSYYITGRVLNFMNYGSNSSRTRTLIIGVDKRYENQIVPLDLFPDYRKEPTLRDVVYNFKRLEWGEIDSSDFYHAFRTYDLEMRQWIHDLKAGQSAFDNEDPLKRPHTIKDDVYVPNVQKTRDKYTRQPWDRFIQCVQTRNDQLAAQNTIHPEQDRVYSIRELMAMMSIPESFQWLPLLLAELNALSDFEKRKIYKDNETNIRQCLGEAVPTEVMHQVALKIKSFFDSPISTSADINSFIDEFCLNERTNLLSFIKENPKKLNVSALMRIVELVNSKRTENSAFYTNKFIVNAVVSSLPSFSKDSISILEPSVGAGNFLPLLIKKYADVERVDLDVVDIDPESIETLKLLLEKVTIPPNIHLSFHCEDFLLYHPGKHYDLVVGNPPFSKLKVDSKNDPRLMESSNKDTKNLAALFLDKSMKIADYVSLVLNKTILSSSEYSQTRSMVARKRIERIIDFGRYGFTGVSIETMSVLVNCLKRPGKVTIENLKFNFHKEQEQSYITDSKFPAFLIYRNQEFDQTADKLQFNVFDCFRDRQITKSNTSENKTNQCIWVVKGKNLSIDGNSVEHINGYDRFIDISVVRQMSVYQYLNRHDVYLTPNMTYSPRVFANIDNALPDGSIAVLIPKEPMVLSQEQMAFFSTEEYRKFYTIARNLSTQSINVDSSSVFFYGVLKA